MYNKYIQGNETLKAFTNIKPFVLVLLLCTGCTCSKQSPLKAYRYTPPPPPQNTVWTWTKLNWGGVEAQAITVDPTNGSIVYVASRNDFGGVWKSYDGGGSFAKVWDRGAWGGIALDPQNSSVIYAALAGGGVWRSRDGGSTWFQLTNLYADYVQPDRFDTSYIYAGPWRSTDYGASWSQSIPFGRGPDEVKDLVQSWQNPDLLYTGRFIATAGRIIYKSTDRGRTWIFVEGGVGVSFYQLAIDPWNDQRVYYIGWYSSVSEDSLCRTTDGGATWEKYPVGRNAVGNLYIPVAVDPRPGLNQVIYAGGQGVHRSVDYGKTWQLIGLDSLLIRDIAVDPTAPTNSTVLYVAAPYCNPPCDRIYRGTPGQ